MRGAPLRFAAAIVGGWAAGRFAVLWPVPVSPATLVMPPVAAAERVVPVAPISAGAAAFVSSRPGKTTATRLAASVPTRIIGARLAPPLDIRPAPAPATATATGGPEHDRPSDTTKPQRLPDASLPSIDARSRLSVDAWLVARRGGGDSLAFGQLGASQGGARLTYALDGNRHVALSARLSAPVRGNGAEAGVGLDIRPTRLPVHLLVEQRIGLDGGGTRPAVAVIAGASTALPARARLDTYAQGGAVWRRGGFFDGAALVTRPVFQRGRTRVELGGGAWGATQRRVARLDLGPSVALAAPSGDIALRLQLDYRARVTGHARPGSGPALTLGGSF